MATMRSAPADALGTPVQGSGPVVDRPLSTSSVEGARVTCPLDQLTERITVIDGIALVRDGRQVHAFPAACPHGAASLAEGAVRGGAVTCPRHGARFRLRDGRVLAGPTRKPLALLTAVVRDGVVQVVDGAPARRPVLDRLRDAVKEAFGG